MPDIYVVRGAGDLPGEDIVDDLISSIPVAIQRGRNELDRLASGMQEVSCEAVFRPNVLPGQLAKFYSTQGGPAWVGKVNGVTHTYSDGELVTQLDVEKPTKFY